MGNDMMRKDKSMNWVKYVALDLLKDCFAEEIEHLKLRIIRDNQAPRFEAIKDEHPEIWKDFSTARSDCHETLLRVRRKRIKVLRGIVEGEELPERS